MEHENLLVDMIGEIDPNYIEESYERRRQRGERRTGVKRYGALAACVALAAVVSLTTLLPGEAQPQPSLSGDQNDTPDIVQPSAPAQVQIMFANDVQTQGDEVEVDAIYDPDSGKSLFFSALMWDGFEMAEDDMVFAFTVQVFGVEEAKRFPELEEPVSQAQRDLLRVTEECVAELVTQQGISEEEARARKFTHPRFIAAREAYKNAVAEYAEVWVPTLYRQYKAAFDALRELGCTVLYTGEDVEYIPYLYERNAIGVMTATKAQLLEWKDKEMEYQYFLAAAAEDAAEQDYTDNFTWSELSLADGSKLTDDVIAAFEKADGGSIQVLCKIGYFGKRYTDRGERQQAIYAALGTTEEQYWSSGDPIGELWERYHKANENILFHIDYNNEVAEKLLKDGELVEMQARSSAFIAELTYERALELVENREIAYIHIIQTPASDRNDFQQVVVEADVWKAELD